MYQPRTRKDPSYRKPVPVYVPSPPPSPPSAPSSELQRLSLSSLEELPPLPMDWRSAIENAMASNKSSRGFRRIGEDGFVSAQTEKQSPSTYLLEIPHWSSSNYLTSSTDSRNTSSRSSTPSLKKKRRVYQNYRPPTPPLPAHYKSTRLPDDDSGLPYSTFGTLQPPYGDSQAPSSSASLPSSRRPSTAGTFATAPTFMTENSRLSSTVAFDPSVAWISGNAYAEAEEERVRRQLSAVPQSPQDSLKESRAGRSCWNVLIEGLNSFGVFLTSAFKTG